VEPEPIIDLFEHEVPLPFINDTVRLLFEAYPRAFEVCRSMPREVAQDYRGHLRRALIEERWPLVAQRHRSSGVWASYQSNQRRTSYFTQVVCGRVVLTQSCVDTPETIVRRAEFRNTLARSNQRDLFGDDPPPLPSDPLYALLIHGENQRRRQPYFAHVVFPAPDCRSYLARIDLFALCHALVDPLLEPTVQEEIIPDEATPRLRAIDNRDA
jgi:hypothetical protein